jgi:hypothetical protein
MRTTNRLALPMGRGAAAANTIVRTPAARLGQMVRDRRAARAVCLFANDPEPMSACTDSVASYRPSVPPEGTVHLRCPACATQLGSVAAPGCGRHHSQHAHPPYYFGGDQPADATIGQAPNQLGAERYVLDPAGHHPERHQQPRRLLIPASCWPFGGIGEIGPDPTTGPIAEANKW